MLPSIMTRMQVCSLRTGTLGSMQGLTPKLMVTAGMILMSDKCFQIDTELYSHMYVHD